MSAQPSQLAVEAGVMGAELHAENAALRMKVDALTTALARATNKMDESAHRLRNLHLILARELDDAVSAGRFVLRNIGAP